MARPKRGESPPRGARVSCRRSRRLAELEARRCRLPPEEASEPSRRSSRRLLEQRERRRKEEERRAGAPEGGVRAAPLARRAERGVAHRLVLQEGRFKVDKYPKVDGLLHIRLKEGCLLDVVVRGRAFLATVDAGEDFCYMKFSKARELGLLQRMRDRVTMSKAFLPYQLNKILFGVVRKVQVKVAAVEKHWFCDFLVFPERFDFEVPRIYQENDVRDFVINCWTLKRYHAVQIFDDEGSSLFFKRRMPLRAPLSMSRQLLMPAERREAEDSAGPVSIRIHPGFLLPRMSVSFLGEFYEFENWPQSLKLQLFRGEKKTVLFMPSLGLCYDRHHILFTRKYLQKYWCAIDYEKAVLFIRLKGKICKVRLEEEKGQI